MLILELWHVLQIDVSLFMNIPFTSSWSVFLVLYSENLPATDSIELLVYWMLILKYWPSHRHHLSQPPFNHSHTQNIIKLHWSPIALLVCTPENLWVWRSISVTKFLFLKIPLNIINLDIGRPGVKILKKICFLLSDICYCKFWW